MTKKIICLIIAIVSLATLSYGKNENRHKKKTRSKLHNARKNYNSKQQKSMAATLYSRLVNCPKENGCGLDTNYCTIQNCDSIIASCHRITKEEFDTMTNSGQSGFAEFSGQQLFNVLDGASCNQNWTQCYIHHTWLNIKTYYRMVQVNDTIPDSLEGETYYSYTLLKYIYDQGVDTITLYRGVNIENNKIIMPFKIKYLDPNRPEEYFDVSDTQP